MSPSSPTPLDPAAFAASQLSLLAADLAADTAATAALLACLSPKLLARAGLAVTNLVLAGRRTGLGGKTVLALEGDGAVGGTAVGGEEVGVRVGDVVGVRKGERTVVEGVVVRVGGGRQVQVAVAEGAGEEELEFGGRVWV